MKEEEYYDPCKKLACEYQYCLERANLREEKCLNVIQKLIKCCQETYGETGRLKHLPVSPTCSGFVNRPAK